MHELEYAYTKWRTKLLHINIYVALFAFLIELMMFFVLRNFNLILQPIPVYFTFFLVIPTIANLLIIIVGDIITLHVPKNSMYINYIPIVQLATICTVLASIHNIFSITLCFFTFPLFMTAVFADKKMLRHMTILCFSLLTFTLLYRKLAIYKPANDTYFYAEAIVAYFVTLATSIASEVLINFQIDKINIIKQGYLCQVEMQDKLYRDQKTGLFGQSIFYETLNHMVNEVNRSEKDLLLAIIDIDDFKKINDTYGHLKGDQIINNLAETLKKVFYSNQFVSRFGGEEFAIIFTDYELDKAIALLEQLRVTFERQSYEYIKDTVTISIGIAKWQTGWTAEQLFEAADSSMYISKHQGKNQISVFD